MRITPKQLLQGLLYLTPITLLALASCGGGGGGSSATPASAYTLSVNVTGVSAASSPLVLRNGGDNLTINAPGTYSFQHQVLSGTTYNISVYNQPSTPTQLCTVASPIAVMPASAKTVNVSCAAAYKIGGTISGLSSDGLVLQNNGGDNYQAASGVTGFTFNTPVASNNPYNVTILTQPLGLGQTCSVTAAASSVSVTADVSNVAISCTTYTAPSPDPYIYTTNSGSTNNVYAYTSSSGALTGNGTLTQGSGRAAITADRAGQFVLIASGTSSGSVASYKIGTTGALAKVNEVATGNTPFAIAVHPSGKFAYVVNEVSNSISAYSIDTSGVLASIDANGNTTAYEPTIRAGDIPVAIAIDPAGSYAYVANANSGSASSICGISISNNGCITVFAINKTTGALTPTNATGTGGSNISTGNGPTSIVIDPSGKFVYVTNLNDDTVSDYAINSADGTLLALSQSPYSTGAGTGPSSITIYPDGTFAYVTDSATGKVATYPRDTTTGVLGTPTTLSTGATGTTAPNSISIDSSGHYAYVANSGTNSISVFSISGGALSKVACPGGPSPTCTANSNFTTGAGPVAVITAP